MSMQYSWSISTKQVIVGGMLSDEDSMVAELSEFANVGGRTVTDCTTDMIGRNPLALATMSRRTGLHIVMGCGLYREPFFMQLIDQRSVNQSADELVHEIEFGVGNTDRPGIIGEIGSEKYITSCEERGSRSGWWRGTDVDGARHHDAYRPVAERT